MIKSDRQKIIEEKIRQNPLAWENYFELGKCLENINKYQAYLCYENALFFLKDNPCDDIKNAMNNIVSQGGRVSKSAIVILSYNLREDTQNCIESIRETTPESAREIIVIDNNSKDDSVEYLRKQKDIVLIENDFNAGFPGGCNIGIKASSSDADILLLNNDVIMCANSLFWLRMGLYESDEYGSAGSVCNIWYNWQNVCEDGQSIEWYKDFAIKNNVPKDNFIEYKTYLLGYALLIKRKVMDKIGLLDEGFFPGNFEDNDLGLRIMELGYANVLVYNSFLIHLCSKTFKKEEKFNSVLDTNRNKFNIKYGENTHVLMNADGIAYLVYGGTGEIDGTEKVLEIGCGIGATLFSLMHKYPETVFYGTDTDYRTGRFGLNHAKCIIRGYYSLEKLPFEEKYFDLICLNGEKIQKKQLDEYLFCARKYLKSGGSLLMVVDNIKHYSKWIPILMGREIKITDDRVTVPYLESLLEKHNAIIEKWHIYQENLNEDSQVSEIIDSLPSDYSREAKIKRFGLTIKFL